MSGRSTAGIMETPAADRPLYKRWTVVGIAIIGIVQALESQGLIPAGGLEKAAELGQVAGGILTALGLYRHIPTT